MGLRKLESQVVMNKFSFNLNNNNSGNKALANFNEPLEDNIKKLDIVEDEHQDSSLGCFA